MVKYSIFVLVCVLITQVGYDLQEDWSQFGHDPQRTYASETAIFKNLRVKWQYHIETKDKSAPAVSGNRVYMLEEHSVLSWTI